MVEHKALPLKLEERQGGWGLPPAMYVLASVVRQEKDTNGIKFGKEGNKKSTLLLGAGCRVRSLGDACPHFTYCHPYPFQREVNVPNTAQTQ